MNASGLKRKAFLPCANTYLLETWGVVQLIVPNLIGSAELIQTQTHAGSFLCSDTASDVNHEALHDPWVLGQLQTFRAAQNVPLTFMGLSLHTYRLLLFFFSCFLSHLRVTKSTHVTNAAGISVLLTEFPESTRPGLMLHFCSWAQVLLPSLAPEQYPCQSRELNTVFGCILFLPDYDVLNVDSITLQNSVWSR